MGPRDRGIEYPSKEEMDGVEDEWYKDPYEDPDDPDGWSEFPDD